MPAWRGLALLALAAMLALQAACAQRNVVPRAGTLEPPPIPARRPAAPGELPAVAAAAPALQQIPSRYGVQAGDTVYSIARQFGLPLRSVIVENDLRAPFVLQVGQELRLPAPRVHEVVAGDTVYGISRRHAVDMAELVRQNDIPEPYQIRVGQILLLPDARGAELGAVAVAQSGGASLPQGEPSGAVPSPGEIARLPDGRPVGGGVEPSPGTAVEPTAPGAALDPEEPPQALPDSAAPSEAAAAPAAGGASGQPAVQTRKPEVAAIPAPPPRSGGKFAWPLRGELLSAFGAKGSGLHNDGLNIAAPRGTKILAAENGVVAYAGNELRGFGNLLLIKHQDGWVTAYAHAERLLVRRGDKVRRGQPIALVGSSGNVSSPQLHFEIRKGTRAIDPEKVLAPRVASAS